MICVPCLKMDLAVVVCELVYETFYFIYMHSPLWLKIQKHFDRNAAKTKKKLKYFVENFTDKYFYFKKCDCYKLNFFKECNCEIKHCTQYFYYGCKNDYDIRHILLNSICDITTSNKKIQYSMRGFIYDVFSEELETLYDENNNKMYRFNVEELRIMLNCCSENIYNSYNNNKSFYLIEKNEEYESNKKLLKFMKNKKNYSENPHNPHNYNYFLYIENLLRYLVIVEKSVEEYERKLKLIYVGKKFNWDIAYLCKDFL